jgi:hypothetical protein
MIDVQSAISLLMGSKPLRAALCLIRNVAAGSSRRMPHALVPGALVERIGELVEDWLRRPFGRKQGVPGPMPGSRASQLRFAVGNIRQGRTALRNAQR